MRFYLTRLAAIFIALLVGVCTVWIWTSGSTTSLAEAVYGEPVAPVVPVTTAERFDPYPDTPVITQSLSPKKETQIRKSVPITKHESFEDVCLRLRKLPAFMGKYGGQTFYISDVKYDDGEYAYAFWKEENSIIVFQLPLYGEPTDSDLYWLSGKAYTDLNEDVVPKELGNMGCCLMTKAWADKTVRACKSGYKLEINVNANIR